MIKPTLIGLNMIPCKFGSIKLTISCPSKVSKFFSLGLQWGSELEWTYIEWGWTYIPHVP